MKDVMSNDELDFGGAHFVQEKEDSVPGIVEANKLLKDCLFALNDIRRTRIHLEGYSDTYELAAAVSKYLKTQS